MSKIKFVGLDVHAETIAVAVAEWGGEVRSLGIIPNREESIRRLVKKLGPAEQLQACYEAGPTGYIVYWRLTALGVNCEVVGPTLVPAKAGDTLSTVRADRLGSVIGSGNIKAALEAELDGMKAPVKSFLADSQNWQESLSPILTRGNRRTRESRRRHHP